MDKGEVEVITKGEAESFAGLCHVLGFRSLIRRGGPSSCTRRLECPVSGEIFGHNWSRSYCKFHYRFSCSVDRFVSKSKWLHVVIFQLFLS